MVALWLPYARSYAAMMELFEESPCCFPSWLFEESPYCFSSWLHQFTFLPKCTRVPFSSHSLQCLSFLNFDDSHSIWSLQLVWCCLILTKRREMKAKVINPTLLSWRKKMGNTPPYWTMSLSLSFRKGLEEFRKTEQSKTNKQTRTKQDSLHNTAFIYKESLSSNSIYSWYPSGNTRVQVGFGCFFPFLDMYLMINHPQIYQTLLILEQCGLNIN